MLSSILIKLYDHVDCVGICVYCFCHICCKTETTNFRDMCLENSLPPSEIHTIAEVVNITKKKTACLVRTFSTSDILSLFNYIVVYTIVIQI